ncbi:HDOD domain-containing protein, partial [Klebsiella pneumoniae]
QTLPAALHKLAAGQSMNLILGLALKHNVVLGDPALVAYAERHWQLSQDTADYARRLARMLELDHERCYSAGILHRLGDL